MVVIVTGSRDWEDYDTLRSYMDHVSYINGTKFSVIIHGDCKGVDQLARQYAAEQGINVVAFPADWTLGNKAGPIRNQEMINWALTRYTNALTEVICIAFPLPSSKGTWDCIRRCERAKIRTYVWGLD